MTTDAFPTTTDTDSGVEAPITLMDKILAKFGIKKREETSNGVVTEEDFIGTNRGNTQGLFRRGMPRINQ